jgi:RimJ/RimL family protein N-acetyltransferase
MKFPRDVPTLTDASPTDSRVGDVTIRAHRSGDAQGSYEQCLDPLSREWTTVPLEYTRADAHHFVTQVMPGGWEAGTEWGFAVEAVDDDGVPRYAGTISLRPEGERRAEVAYGSHPWVRGRGVMERALRLLLAWGFEEQGLETVIWWANRGNWASRKLAWRLGFTHEGAVRHWLPQRGELLDAWVGTLLAGDPRRPLTLWYDAPHIVGEVAVLRPLEKRDVPRIVEGCTDPETVRWLGQLPQPYTAKDAEEFLETVPERHATGTAVIWAVADPSTDDLIGTANLFDIRRGRDAETGYWIHPAARGRGVATEATRLMLRHAFVPVEDGGLGLERVRAIAAEGNTASRRVLERAGLTHQGRERGVVLVRGGTPADAAIYDVVAGELDY